MTDNYWIYNGSEFSKTDDRHKWISRSLNPPRDIPSSSRKSCWKPQTKSILKGTRKKKKRNTKDENKSFKEVSLTLKIIFQDKLWKPKVK